MKPLTRRTSLRSCRARRSGASGLVALLLLVGGGWDFLTPHPDVAEGNRLYAQGAYADALAAYRRARASDTGRGGDSARSARLALNVGAALYKLATARGADGAGTRGLTDRPDAAVARDALLDEAEAAFRAAARTRDRTLRSAAYHNLGNTLVQRDRLDDAASAYRSALRANPDNDDARYNLELISRRLAQRQDDRRQDSRPGGGQPGQRPRAGSPGPRGQPGRGGPQDPGGESDSDARGADPGTEAGSDPGSGASDPGGDPGGARARSDRDAAGRSAPDTAPAPGDGVGDDAASTGGSSADDRRAPDTGPGAGSDHHDGDASSPAHPDSATRPGSASAPSEIDRKLERLDRLSRELRRRQLHSAYRARGRDTRAAEEDW